MRASSTVSHQELDLLRQYEFLSILLIVLRLVPDTHTEMEQLWRLKVFEEVPRSEVPEGEPIIPTHFVTKKKLNQFGLVKQYKARCVANGKRQIPGVSFDEHASSTPSLDSVRASLAIANHFDMDIDLVDIVGAYTHAPLDRVIYCDWPLGFDKGGPTVMKVNKALYGFVQSGRKYQDDRNIKLEGAGYKQNPMDTSVFYRRHEKVLTILVPYVDNFLVISTKGTAKKIKEELAQLFEIKDEGEAKFYLGMMITRNRPQKQLTISMPAYIKGIVQRADLSWAKTASTPMSHTQPMSRANRRRRH
ncbi:Copia protein [Ceratobasidium sp. AG-Ba]|nr:Copia protein [Ceratobasidium sp. AG-Ba]